MTPQAAQATSDGNQPDWVWGIAQRLTPHHASRSQPSRLPVRATQSAMGSQRLGSGACRITARLAASITTNQPAVSHHAPH